ncbi:MULTISPECIES: factor H binding protein domain-containing protein [Haemophilus]|uniref:factor H binding protein domain-containing protein n=1 Tax=Haemophilus TaxID=724 RepID=UPI0025AF3D51|nr:MULTISPECIES: factor H binding protein domain-containing protein [Haemophilus]MDN3212229.1 factor H binding family protein [Haemophilus sp. SZY H51]
MKLKNLSIATALLLALTGCGSSGGGNSDNPPTTPNNEIQNNQTTQNQANTQQAELDRLKTQLSQAQNEKQTAEDKLKQAEQLSAQDLNKAKAGLQKAQEELAAAQKALDEKLSLEKMLTRDEVFQFALHNGLNTVDSSEFADNFKNNSKSFVTEQLVEVHKIIALKRLARSYSLSEDEVRNFVNANKDKTLNEARTLLNDKRTERENLINELTALAKQKGLEEWEARNFAYGKNYTDKESAVQDLNNYIAEKDKRKTKIDELINLAKEKGLDDWEAQNFANSNIENERTKALENLDNLLIEKEQSAILDAKRNIIREAYKTPEGFTRKYDPQETTSSNVRGEESSKQTSYIDVYNQKYSIVVGKYEDYKNLNDPMYNRETYSVSIQRNYLNGVNTKDIPNEGKATYIGTAFTKDREGMLTYNVDFANKKGEGNITGLDGLGNLTLHEGNLAEIYGKDWGKGISSDMTSDKWTNMKGEYLLLFYGKNAEEIAGVAEFGKENVSYDDQEVKELFKVVPRNGERNLHYSSSDNIAIGFGGTRGEIQK